MKRIISDFTEFCQWVSISLESEGLCFVIYKSLTEREESIKEINEDLDIIFKLKTSSFILTDENGYAGINKITELPNKIIHVLDIDKFLHSNKPVYPILETKREVITNNKILIVWTTNDELKYLSEISPNFFSYGRSNIFELNDDSNLNKEKVDEIIKGFENKYSLDSEKLLKGELPPEYDSYEINFWKFLLSLNIGK